ncbi:N-acetylmuramoyl-L-alanine amidase [Lutispora thermophila]|uniref:N-acetylmuramoyl-L-alanine amidase n=1 Tax=Lutispora thermophila DSM 19022 TaxID=1122184 RepID=A0A1M6CRB2_9FIRM|nr:peptidoglycan recognition family protein [Lutispora thermophila]SHI63510.1 N-acetyl-anhydromuramyl-L-alanine amidase AmpD [Lutispora thermophila DSM 19022]
MKKEFKIEKKLSPNKYNGRNGWKPDMIVNHITEGSFEGSVSWLCNPKSQASAHFVVAKDGRIVQLVELKDSAWANGTSTDISKNNHCSKSTLEKVRFRKTNANYYTISIEHEGFSGQGQGRLTDIQLEATIWLHRYIINEVKRIYGIEIPLDRDHIVGHYQIDPIRKPNCPGQNFQFQEIIKALREDVVNMTLEKWKEEMGIKSIDNLAKKGIVNNPEEWKKSLGENVPQWLFWSMIDRIAKEVK